MPLQARQVQRFHGPARRTHHQGQALVLRLVPAPEGLLRYRGRGHQQPAGPDQGLDRQVHGEGQLAGFVQAPADRHLPPRQQANRQWSGRELRADHGLESSQRYADPWALLQRRPVRQDRPRRALLGFLRHRFRRSHRSQSAPRPHPVHRPRYGLHERRALLLVRGGAPANDRDGQALAPGRQLPGHEPRLQVRRAVQRRGGPGTLRAQQCGLHVHLRWYVVRLRVRAATLQLQRQQPQPRLLHRRHGAGERPTLVQPRVALRLQQGLFRFPGGARPIRDTPPAPRSRSAISTPGRTSRRGSASTGSSLATDAPSFGATGVATIARSPRASSPTSSGTT